MAEVKHVAKIAEGVASRLPDESDLAGRFAQLSWSKLPEEDFSGRDVDDDVGATIASWRVFRERQHESVHVSVQNPDHSRDGWHSAHSVVRVLVDDSPFVIDSVLMVLSHGGLVTHMLGNVVFSVERGADGVLQDCSVDQNGRARETFLYAEIDRVEDARIDELEKEIRRTLGDVRLAVSDFPVMQNRARGWLAELQSREGDEAAECAAFVAWLLDNHFTFLGYREFRYVDGYVEQVEDSALGILKSRRASTRRKLADQPQSVRDFLLEPVILSFSKSGTLSRVHRPAYPDYVGLRLLDEAGNVVAEQGFLGLYTSRVYLEHPSSIPIVRRKVQTVIERSGLDPRGFDGKVLAQVLATYPRDELLQIDADLLQANALDITYIHERRRTRAFFRYDRYGLFVTCIVYMPRDLYNTHVRQSMQGLLEEAFDAEHAEFQPYFSESILVRLHFTLRVRTGGREDVNLHVLEQQIVSLTRDWQAELAAEATQHFGEVQGRLLTRSIGSAFPAGYRETYTPRSAIDDIVHLLRVRDGSSLVSQLFRLPEDPDDWLRLKVFHANEHLPLSDVIPALENMGFRVLGETPHIITNEAGERFSIQDFQLRASQGLDLAAVADLFEAGFEQIWHERVDNDRFNQLILSPGLSWRQVDVLRAYARYNKQLRFGFSIEFMAEVLVAHPHAASLLVQIFEARFALEEGAPESERELVQLADYFESVSVLNEDRILRRFLELIQATVRTNYFVEGQEALAFKMNPRKLRNVPRPVPEFEIFVCGASMEGVHLRGGPIARGGLRWSDRLEDYRTEVLGLVKAQAVKNAVIVPVGAKGGFVIKRSTTGDRARDGVLAYETFISGLLSVTDNLCEGKIVPPVDVKRIDGDDPYLVVAADKGTATFSDKANALAVERNFWLGDAFASGGSNGYDHKKMGITARGAWISVQRHFAERGIDVQKEPVTVLGIGDMGGDVFGNGMLLSSAIELVAAFNHRHIFIDPDPDTQMSFEERKRLFESPQSAWSDYRAELISTGGGVFDRSAKNIAITEQMRERFGIQEPYLSPDELIHELLKSPVDLIWNGGIGTYAKDDSETDEAVGDRSNDNVRVLASQMRCGVFGEGGNLGLTQRARVAFALGGGGVNTDFIDNSAGVDCSDHEVNIKILLGELVAAGELTLKHRNELLEEMTDGVAELVLDNNRRQVLCLSLAMRHAQHRHDEYRRLLDRFERDMSLDRALEALPEDETLAERFAQGGELTRPELAVLLANAKMQIKQELAGSTLLNDPHVAFLLHSAFPQQIVERYAQALSNHRLVGEILATQIANDLVHHVGISFVMQMGELVGGSVEEIVWAYLVAADTLDLRHQWRTIEGLEIDEDTRLEMLLELMRLTRRSARWFLRHRRAAGAIDDVAQEFAGCVQQLAEERGSHMGEDSGRRWREQCEAWQRLGVPAAIAERTANAGEFGSVLPIIHAAHQNDHDVKRMAARFSEIGETMSFGWLTSMLSSLPTSSHWQAMERDSVLDEVTLHQGLLAAGTLVEGGSLDSWMANHTSFVETWQRVLDEVMRTGGGDFSMYTMTCRKLTDLCRTLG